MNSVFSENIPPQIVSLVHSPTIPTSSDDVLIQARIIDHDGRIASASVFFKKDADEDYLSLPMIREGDWDLCRALLPRQPDGTLVEFFIRAEDDQGAVSVRPSGAPGILSAETGAPVTISYLYMVDEAAYPANMPIYRLLLTQENLTEIEARPLTSDILLSAGLVYDNQAFYDVAIRYREQNRWRRGIRLEMRGAERLHGERKINLSKYGAIEERLSAALFESGGVPFYQTRDIRVVINASDKGYYLDLERLDEDFAQRHFPSDSDGTLVRGRWEVIQGDNIAAIDHLWDVTLLKYNDPRYEELVRAELDVSQWIRCLAAIVMTGNWDCLLGGIFGNMVNYQRPSDGRVLLFPFDMDEGFHHPRIGIHGEITPNWHADPRVENFLLYPPFRREFYEDITTFIDGQFCPENFFPLVDEICARTGQSSYQQGTLKTFVQERIAYLEQVIENYVDQTEPFAAVVETNAGARFFTDQAEVSVKGAVLPGSASVEVIRVEEEPPNLLINGGFEEGITGWSVEQAPPYVSVSPDSSVSHTGRTSIKVVISGDDPDYYGVVQTVECLPLTKYRLSYRLRATGMDKGNMFVNVMDPDNGEEYLSVYVPEQRQLGPYVYLRNDCDWTYYSGIVTTKEDTRRLAIRICRVEIYHAISGEAKGNVWYDDLRLEEVRHGRQPLGSATCDPTTGRWSTVLSLNPGDNIFEFVAYPLASRDYPAPATPLSIYQSDDADEDGLPDAWENEHLGSLAWGAADDPDDDNLTNENEFLFRTHPSNSDTGGDGMPDGWEVSRGLDPTLFSDAWWDADGDGKSNLAEYLVETIPLDPTSPFAVLRLLNIGNGIAVVWYSTPGMTYRVLCSADLISWAALGDPITANHTLSYIVDYAPAEHQTRFYRVELLQ